jgi:hypothetical protein
MGVIILIRRCVRREKNRNFLQAIERDKPTHPDPISETLTKVSEREDLPIRCKDCTTYVNVAHWKTADAFIEHMKPKRTHEATFECEDRVRIVLEEI